MRVTIKDIAQATGYSTATVSLVLNNKPFRIPQQTRRKILTTAKRLGYIKQQTERALKNVHSTTLGVIVPSINYPYNNRIVEGIEN